MEKMVSGILEVTLFEARSLKDTDSFGKMDPYVLVQYKDHKLKSKVAEGQGSNPTWNDKLTFWVQHLEEDDHNITLKIMDQDLGIDDFVGEVGINLKDFVALGVKEGKAELQPQSYNVCRQNKTCAGELKVGFTFKLGSISS